VEAAKVLAGLDAGRPRSAYLLVGEEDFLKDAVLRKVREAIFGPAGPHGQDDSLDSQVFDGAQTSAQAVTQVAETFPFLAVRRLIVVKDPDLADPAWTRYLGSPQPSTCLVLYCHDEPAAKVLTPYRALARDEGLEIVECAGPKKRDLAAWVIERAREYGKVMARDAAQYLAEAAGVSLLALDSEIAKLAAYVGPRPGIARSDVQAVTAQIIAPQVFAFIDAVVEKDSGRALASLAGMLTRSGAELQILATVHGHYRRLAYARSGLDRGVAEGDILPLLSGNAWAARKCLDQARRLTGEHIRKAIIRLYRADLAIKTGQQEPRLALELMSLDLCSETLPRPR
jgi:DNA polymerase-3 subunit delta